MKTGNRLFQFGLAALLLAFSFAFGVFAAATSFTDVNERDETLTKAVSLLEGLGVAKGTSKTTFGTSESVTRQQMAAFIYRLMKRGQSVEGGENNTPFEDLYDDTYFSMISWASSMGIIKGVSDTEFDPDGGIILQDAYTMLVRALGYEKKEALAYPFDYIGIAEKKGVELGKGLPSSVGYEKELTRGNVAILLYNAFYAETGVAETTEKARLIGDPDDPEAKRKYVLETVEEYPRLCEKVYDVIEEDFQIMETPHYAFNTSKNANDYKPTEDAMGEGTVLLVATENDQKIANLYTTVEDLGLKNDADDLIMSCVTLFYTYDESKKTVDKVFYTEPLLDKLSANSVGFGSYNKAKTPSNMSYYYDKDCPKMNGSLTAAGKTLWFCDAPYSYLEPSYDGLATEEERYAARNADNSKLIDLVCLDIDKGLYTWYVKDYQFAPKESGANRMCDVFNTIRTEGVYSVDIFDPDGDGRYEYMWYKPATFGQIIMDEDYVFTDYPEHAANKPVLIANDKKKSSIDLDKRPVIYAYGADLAGAVFHNGDFVLAYLNGDANFIQVYDVCQAKRGTVTKVSTSAENAILTLGKQVYRPCYQFLYVENYFYGEYYSYDIQYDSAKKDQFSDLISAKALNCRVTLYVFSRFFDNVFYYEVESEDNSIYQGQPLLIPLEAESEPVFDDVSKKTMQYLKCWVDGAVKYIPIDVEESYPNPIKTDHGTYSFGVTVTEDDGRTYDAYVNKLCTYDVSANGVYILHSLLHAENGEGDKDHIELVFDIDKFADGKKTNQAGTDVASADEDEGIILKKKLSNRYALLDASDYSMFGTFGTSAADAWWFNDAVVDKDTTFILRTTKIEDGEPTYEFVTYTGDKFPGTTETYFTNVQYIYENSEDNTSKAKLLLFYGEVPLNEDVSFTDGSGKTSDWRIVVAANPAKDSEDKYRYYYDVIDPASAKIEEGIPGSTTKGTAAALTAVDPLAPGTAVKLTAAGYVSEKEASFMGIIDPQTNEYLIAILDADADNCMEVEPMGDGAEELLTEDGELYSVIEVDSGTTVTVLTYEKISDIGTAKVTAAAYKDVCGAKNAVKAYNSKVESKNDKLETKYAKNIKAFITYSKKAKADYPVADQIVIIVNPDEPLELLDD